MLLKRGHFWNYVRNTGKVWNVVQVGDGEYTRNLYQLCEKWTIKKNQRWKEYPMYNKKKKG